jgi:2-polyprenyl-3-methyl-5-hydroxy-6-metoxy-1,4-benzoquinol methylase
MQIIKLLDRMLQQQRIKRVRHHIRSEDTVLDFGCFDGQLFKKLGHLMAGGIGIDSDPSIEGCFDGLGENFQFLSGGLELLTRENLPKIDLVVALAVIEHLHETQIREFALRLGSLVEPSGRMLLTIPHPFVDKIVAAGISLHLLAGADFDSHHGLKPLAASNIIDASGWVLKSWKKFQLGLNNEFLFIRS